MNNRINITNQIKMFLTIRKITYQIDGEIGALSLILICWEREEWLLRNQITKLISKRKSGRVA